MFTDKQIGVVALVVTMLIFSSSGSVFQRIVNDEKDRGNACNVSVESYNSSNCSSSDDAVFTACNMLCGSNLIGLITLPPLFRSDLTMKNLCAVRLAVCDALLRHALCIPHTYTLFVCLFVPAVRHDPSSLCALIFS